MDRYYENGKRYLFMPNNGGGSEFTDNSCSLTREFNADLGAYRPATARRYPPARPGPPLIPLAAGAVLLITAAIGAVVLRRSKTGAASAG